MAADMVSVILKAENAARKEEAKVRQRAEMIVSEAESQAEKIRESVIDQAEKEALLIASEADFSASGIIKQAEKLADLREKKVIAETEKKYDEAIKIVLDSLF
ncbi:MAG: hypothetical protein NC110_06850 [Ruminococcus sp.]|nr:hypothetical protein [Ruminococcus sp.]